MANQPATQRTSADTDIQDVAAALAFVDELALAGGALAAGTSADMGAPPVREVRTFAPVRLAAVARSRIEALLDAAGIRIDGRAPTDMRVRDSRLHAWLTARGLKALGEAYMNGWWEAEDLDGLLQRVLRVHPDKDVRGIDEAALFIRAKLATSGRPAPAALTRESGDSPDRDLLRSILGERPVASCGYWKDAYNLAGAQEAKFDLVCRKLGLAPGMHVLDVGCGWGEALLFAAINYGVSGVGIAFSQEEAEFARARCAGLPIEIRVQDYRLLEGRFDRSWSIGTFEQIGAKNHRAYFQAMRKCLAPGGLTLLHTIGSSGPRDRLDPWMERHIAPGAMIPAAMQIDEASAGLFVMEDWHNFGTDYDRTLMAWRANFERRWPALCERYDERFYRMWRFYLSAAAATFRCRRNQLWQIVYSPNGLPQGYSAVR